ncbi:acyl-CoA dehydrogenase family protein [Lacimicrobium alkaliphilum]|uniref:Acyl-CoA dehydrogenase n=1 Tax=Lacimicrobium alkaliphilum TaxID=1526571 RepID=A0ABQ1R073_9ALTE|nr:acyl-CoA dehydrogenase family protein [Lacimicrobium alkaliphilum]GGD51305.1 acyl-CoA dehydrogenase [Lacimicrobium alkaliphilum]
MNQSDSSYAATHQVFNQPAALEDFNAYSADKVLQYWVERFDGAWGREKLTQFGQRVGGNLLSAGFEANKQLPEFQSHDRFGHRIDQVSYHPAYHQLMAHAIEAGHTSLPWTENKRGTHVVRAAMAYLHNQADPGSGCPLTMTFASVPAIVQQADVARVWLPLITSCCYDGDNKPYFEKTGVTIGMAMTEKQGGSDVRANTTTAIPVGKAGPGQLYSLTGHKWFCSAPMCDAFLVLAQTNDKLSCFLVPRWRPDGSKNPLHIQRLKNKLGNQSNASSEIEFRGAHGWLLNEEGRGVRTIIEMVALTRYDCMIGSGALMGQAAREAIWHTAGREVFGKPLHQQPLMLNVLADLALEAEAALAISMRIAHALDHKQDPHQASLIRSATSIGKYWICKRAVQHTFEAMECIGGVGYVNENICSRLYREAPVNSIWEGSGNVQCLDLLRVLNKEPDTLKALFAEFEQARGKQHLFDQYLDNLLNAFSEQSDLQGRARQLMEKLALAWQASTLLSYGEEWVAEAFVNARLTEQGYHQYGTLPASIDASALVERALVKLS